MTSIRVQSTGSVTPSVLVSSLINKFSKKGRIGNNQCRKILWKDIGLHVSPLLKICRGLSTMWVCQLDTTSICSDIFSILVCVYFVFVIRSNSFYLYWRTGPMDREPKPPRALKVYTRRKLTRGKKKPEEVSHVNEKLRTIWCSINACFCNTVFYYSLKIVILKCKQQPRWL